MRVPPATYQNPRSLATPSAPPTARGRGRSAPRDPRTNVREAAADLPWVDQATSLSPVILIIDNYDSFTYNLVQMIGGLDGGYEMKVVRNDQATIEELAALKPTHVVLSPGPCTPDEAGICVELVSRFAGQMPLLGVCLGYQCVGQAFGGTVVRAGRLMHGKTSPIHHVGKGMYEGLSNPFTATRYHSLNIERETLPKDFDVVAWSDQDELMGIRHKTMPIDGVQFHPESFLTDEGPRLLSNFLQQ